MFYLHLILLSVQLKHLHLHPPPCTHSRNITGGLFVYNRSVRPLITIQILPGMQRYVTGVKYIRDGIFNIYSYILLNSGDSVFVKRRLCATQGCLPPALPICCPRVAFSQNPFPFSSSDLQQLVHLLLVYF